MRAPTEKMTNYALGIAKVSPEPLTSSILSNFNETYDYIRRNKHHLKKSKVPPKKILAGLYKQNYLDDNRSLWRRLFTLPALVIWALSIYAMYHFEWHTGKVYLILSLALLAHWANFRTESHPTWFVVNKGVWKSFFTIRSAVAWLAFIPVLLTIPMTLPMKALVSTVFLYLQWKTFRLETVPPYYLVKDIDFWYRYFSMDILVVLIFLTGFMFLFEIYFLPLVFGIIFIIRKYKSGSSSVYNDSSFNPEIDDSEFTAPFPGGADSESIALFYNKYHHESDFNTTINNSGFSDFSSIGTDFDSISS